MNHKLTRRGEWAQKIDYSEAAQMLRAGATQQDVGDFFGVTQAAVSNAIRRGVIRVDTDRPQRRAMPWSPIQPEHRSQYLAVMLRAARRRAEGLPENPAAKYHLDVFLRSMESGGWVVNYTAEDGFHRTPRRKGIDLGLIREPDAGSGA